MSRLLIQDTIAEKFISLVKAKFQAVNELTGFDPLDDATQYGPLANSAHLDNVMSYIESGKKSTELLVGGSRKGEKGFFVEPTIFLNPSVDEPIYAEEIFGPVLVIKTFSTVEEGIKLANDTDTGLAGWFPFCSIGELLLT